MAKLQYELKRVHERVGPVSLEIECLADLNKTIDDLFAALEREGKPELLETLCPYFGTIWPSARALAESIVELAAGIPPQERARVSVLELGCGLALPSLVAAHLGMTVTATDFHPEVPRFLERNWELNRDPGGTGSLRFVPLDWQRSPEGLGSFDWVIGSDILYERQHPSLVARAIARQAQAGGAGTRILVTDPGRPYLQAFADEMRGLGYAPEIRARQEIFVLAFTPRRGA